MTDLYIMHHTLINRGASPSNILTYFPEDVYKDERNITKSNIYINNNYKLLYRNLVSRGFRVNDILNCLICNVKELKNVNKTDNILIYIVGHGCHGAMKFYDREWLTKEDFMRCLEKLSGRVNKILLIVDTCEAESLINRNIDNLYIVTTSTYKEPSLSSFKSMKLGVYTVDEFAYFFYQETNQSIDSDLTLDQFFDNLNARKFSSTITWTKNSQFKFRQFFY